MENSQETQFLWKKSDQMKYYNIVCLEYIKNIFKEIKNKPYGFYWNFLTNKEELDLINKYYNGERINIKDFNKNKLFIKHPHEIKITDDEEHNKIEEENVIFTITKYKEENEKAGCHQCKMEYGDGIWFSGLAYNTGIDKENPIEYEGYISTYNFFRCNCDNNNNEIIMNYSSDNFPFTVIECGPINPRLNIVLLKRCVLFGLNYIELKNVNYKIN